MYRPNLSLYLTTIRSDGQWVNDDGWYKKGKHKIKITGKQTAGTAQQVHTGDRRESNHVSPARTTGCTSSTGPE